MAYKTVIQLDLKCSKCKKVALHSVTKIEGIESVTINIPESTLTVIGDADPVCMIQLLKKKFCCVHLVCYGPWPPPEKPKPPKPEKSKPETPKPETSASASATSTSTSTPTFILYNSPCNCRPPQTFPCTPPNNCPPACKPPKCCPPGLSCSACKPPKCCPPGLSCSGCKPPKCCPPGLSCSACKPPKCCPPGLSCSCRLEKCCPTSCPCPNKSEIMWPQYHNPLAPDEVCYVWKEDQQESCTIM